MINVYDNLWKKILKNIIESLDLGEKKYFAILKYFNGIKKEKKFFFYHFSLERSLIFKSYAKIINYIA